MIIQKMRRIYNSKLISVEEYVHGFSTTFILRYEDGRAERVKYYTDSLPVKRDRKLV